MENYHAYFARRVYLDIPPEEVFNYEGCFAPRTEVTFDHTKKGVRRLPYTLDYLTTRKKGTNGTTQQV